MSITTALVSLEINLSSIEVQYRLEVTDRHEMSDHNYVTDRYEVTDQHEVTDGHKGTERHKVKDPFKGTNHHKGDRLSQDDSKA